MRRLLLLFVAAAFTASIGCASTQHIDTNTAEGAYKLATKYEKDERFEEALAQFAQVKNKYPYSKLAVEAELKIADIHFKREEYVEAQNAYEVFKEMHPTHPQIAYVTFRLGLSFFKQLPPTIDRDLSVANRAILYFDEVIETYPTSPYAKQAVNYKTKALKMLADKELYIAHFYFIRDDYQSALGRYEDLIANYPGSGLLAKALYGASISAYKTKNYSKAKEYYNKLTSDFASSNEAKKARGQLGKHFQ